MHVYQISWNSIYQKDDFLKISLIFQRMRLGDEGEKAKIANTHF